MNVIMPTAMVLAKQSKVTAKRAVALLRAVMASQQEDSNRNKDIETTTIHETLTTILRVASSASEDSDGDSTTTTKYWNDFFSKWEYEEQQKKDIANAVDTVLA